MALATIKSPFPTPGAPAPGSFDPTKISQQMQTDPNVRTMFAQFFGDPASRQFVQDSGNITSALARPDNPWTPGTPMVATPSEASPGASFSSAAGPSAETNPGAAPGASLASRAPGAAPGIAPSATTTPGAPQPYSTAQDFFKDHPEEEPVLPARPVAPMDNVHGARKALMLAFLGLNKFGAGLDHQQNSYADEFLGRQLNATQAQAAYDNSQPQLKQQAEDARYSQILGNTEKAAQIAQTGAQTGLVQAQTGSYIGPVQKAVEDMHNSLIQRWQSHADVDAPTFIQNANEQLKAAPVAVQNAIGPLLNGITKLPQTGKGYTVNMQDDLPTSINVGGKDYAPNDPALAALPVGAAAIQDFQRAQAAHDTKRGEKVQDESTVAGYAASRQAAGFEQAEKMKALGEIQPRINTALDANERLSRMESSYEKAKNGDQQAQLALLADHIGMTFGLQKNVRANKALIQEAQESQPWLAKIGAKFDDQGYLSGVALGPEQMKQMLDLGYGARDRAFASAHEAATSYGQPLPAGFTQVEAQRQPGAKPALGQPGAGQLQVGQTVNVKGKQMKVTAVHPDGSFDAQ